MFFECGRRKTARADVQLETITFLVSEGVSPHGGPMVSNDSMTDPIPVCTLSGSQEYILTDVAEGNPE